MRIKFEYCTKMVICFSFIAKPDAPIKGQKHVINIGTQMRMYSWFLLTGCCLKPRLITSISFHKKRPVYAKHI